MQQVYAIDYEFDDSLNRIDFQLVHAWLTACYWSPGIGLEEIKRGAANSTMVVGCYLGKTQVGYMRLVSDKTRFAYIMDVYVLDSHRKKGIAENMIQFVMKHPDLLDVYTWLLATRDAHSVYLKAGFKPLPIPENWLLLKKDKVWK